MTHTETITILRRYNKWRRGNLEGRPMPDPREIGEAIDAAIEMIDRLEAAERSVTEAYQRGYATGQEEIEKERDALRAKIERMERQKPAGVVQWIKGWPVVNAHDGVILEPNKPLYALPGAQPVPSVPVAYLDLGAAGYMDIGTDLTDEALAALPKGRHILGIVGTYGVEGYIQAQPAPSVPEPLTASQAPHSQYAKAWNDCIKAMAETKP